MSGEPEVETPILESRQRKTLRAIGWFSIGMAAASLGIYIGFELRSRYKFRRRTPYDFYANAETQPISEYGVGI